MLDLPQSRRAIAAKPSRNENAHDASAVVGGGGLEQHIDAGTETVLQRAWLQADEIVVEHHVAIGRRDVHVGRFDQLLIRRRDRC
jgi:hypothetical protein